MLQRPQKEELAVGQLLDVRRGAGAGGAARGTQAHGRAGPRGGARRPRGAAAPAEFQTFPSATETACDFGPNEPPWWGAFIGLPVCRCVCGMTLSCIFVMDLKGRVIISRNYRGDVPMSVSER